MLSHNKHKIKKIFINDVDSIFIKRDYAKTLSVRLNNEMHKNKFGFLQRKILIGSNLSFYRANINKDINNKTEINKNNTNI